MVHPFPVQTPPPTAIITLQVAGPPSSPPFRQANVWVEDLTATGGIEPNPGPVDRRGDRLRSSVLDGVPTANGTCRPVNPGASITSDQRDLSPLLQWYHAPLSIGAPRPSASVWVEDLTGDGCVESNPGPRPNLKRSNITPPASYLSCSARPPAGAPPPPATVWVEDLTGDGCVESNPGPQQNPAHTRASRSPTLVVVFVAYLAWATFPAQNIARPQSLLYLAFATS